MDIQTTEGQNDIREGVLCKTRLEAVKPFTRGPDLALLIWSGNPYIAWEPKKAHPCHIPMHLQGGFHAYLTEYNCYRSLLTCEFTFGLSQLSRL